MAQLSAKVGIRVRAGGVAVTRARQPPAPSQPTGRKAASALAECRFSVASPPGRQTPAGGRRGQCGRHRGGFGRGGGSGVREPAVWVAHTEG